MFHFSSYEWAHLWTVDFLPGNLGETGIDTEIAKSLIDLSQGGQAEQGSAGGDDSNQKSKKKHFLIKVCLRS